MLLWLGFLSLLYRRRIYFSPDGAAAQAVITKALVDAHQRGVSVEVILDGKPPKGRYSAAAALTQSGIAVLSDAVHTSAGNNVMVIDRQVVLTGSFSFTPAAAGQSAENLLVIHDPTLAARYGENWQAHAAHSVRSSRR